MSDNEKKIEKYWSEEKQNACKVGGTLSWGYS